MKRTKNKTKGMQVPGQILMKHIKFGEPEIDGMYMCYYKPFPPLAHDNFPMAGMIVVNYFKGKWSTGKNIIAFIGPLPVLSLDELVNNNECQGVNFYTGTLKDAAKGNFNTGPHTQLILANLNGLKKGEFVFDVNTHKSIPVPLVKYSTKRENTVTLDEKNKKKYIKILKKYIKGNL